MMRKNSNNLAGVENILCDSGYQSINFALNVNNIIKTQVTVIKRNEVSKFIVLPKRWIVERSFAWLDKCRRLWKNCEGSLHTSQQMVVLAFISLILKNRL
ncbi:MAG: hypothetical protein RLZZ210_136 [Pseudomonadota bacterium]|jgi:transposase